MSQSDGGGREARSALLELMDRLRRIANDYRREAELWPKNERAQQVARMLRSHADILDAQVDAAGLAAGDKSLDRSALLDLDRLRVFVKVNAPGQCKMLSKGDSCECLLCLIDRLAAGLVAGDRPSLDQMFCDAEHAATGALCELPKGHTQNHRGQFDNGIAQWPQVVAGDRPAPPAPPELEARVIDLEDGIAQAQHTIQFLHQCALKTAGYEYAYPEQTIQHLERLRALFEPLPGCLHSIRRADCPNCVARVDRQQRRANLALPVSPPAPQWQPIETAPKDVDAIFWVVPKSAAEAYCDTSGNPITANFPGHVQLTRFRQWSALSKATHWMPLPDPPVAAPVPQEPPQSATPPIAGLPRYRAYRLWRESVPGPGAELVFLAEGFAAAPVYLEEDVLQLVTDLQQQVAWLKDQIGPDCHAGPSGQE